MNDPLTDWVLAWMSVGPGAAAPHAATLRQDQGSGEGRRQERLSANQQQDLGATLGWASCCAIAGTAAGHRRGWVRSCITQHRDAADFLLVFIVPS